MRWGKKERLTDGWQRPNKHEVRLAIDVNKLESTFGSQMLLKLQKRMDFSSTSQQQTKDNLQG